MKKIIIFTTLLFAIFSFAGCEFCSITVDSKVIGSGIVGHDGDIYWVEIDSIWHPIDFVYVQSLNDRINLSKPTIKPIDGMLVTSFYINGEENFIVGELTKAEIDKYFKKHLTIIVILALLFIIWVLSDLVYSDIKNRKKTKSK